jgi:hypothetical protein
LVVFSRKWKIVLDQREVEGGGFNRIEERLMGEDMKIYCLD